MNNSVKKKLYYSKREKRNFLYLVKTYINRNTKKTDRISLRKKEMAWKRITKKYNALPGVVKRNTAQLQKLWDTLKYNYQKKLHQKKCHLKITANIIDHKYVDNSITDVSQKIQVEHCQVSINANASNDSNLDSKIDNDNIIIEDKIASESSLLLDRNSVPVNPQIIIEELKDDKDEHSNIRIEHDMINCNNLTEKSDYTIKRSKESMIEEIFNLKKKQMIERHNLKKKLYENKYQMYTIKKEYYELKKLELLFRIPSLFQR